MAGLEKIYDIIIFGPICYVAINMVIDILEEMLLLSLSINTYRKFHFLGITSLSNAIILEFI